MSLRILSAANVEHLVANLVGLNELLSHTGQLFHQLSHDTTKISNPLRSSVGMTNHQLMIMPASVCELGTSVKAVAIPSSSSTSSTTSSFPPGLAATTIVFEEESGVPKCILNSRNLTALRTASGSVLATKLLVRGLPSTLALFGAGLQIQYHAEFLLKMYPSIHTCYLFCRSFNSRSQALLNRLHPRCSTTRVLMTDKNGVNRLLRTADILCFATPSIEPLIDSSWIKGGAHVILVGSYTPIMHEVPTDLIHRASKIVVDSKEHVLHEAGELITAGLGPNDLIELGQLLDSDQSPVMDQILTAQAGEITIFKSVGLAVQDLMIAQILTRHAKVASIGTVIDNFD